MLLSASKPLGPSTRHPLRAPRIRDERLPDDSAFVDLNVSLAYRIGKERMLALDDATFTIDKGEFIAVVGPSGCGKSTLMKLVTGLLPATGGEVIVRGQKVTGPIKGVGMAFQNPT